VVNPIRKAVFPVAGLGTRFLPATKATAKEMLTIVDRPALQYVVDEAIEAGIEHMVFVTGRGKGVIEDHFDSAFELEATLKSRNKTKELEQLQRELPKAGTTSFTRQQAPLGLGHAVWCAREIIGNEPFAVLLPDMLMKAEKGCLKQMLTAYEKHGGNVLALEKVPHDQVSKYGVVAVGGQDETGYEITGMVEKPKTEDAPSDLIISGRYILQPEIFDILTHQEPGAGGEIQITDAMIKLMKTQRFTGFEFDGITYDTGSKIGFLTANVAYALERPELGGEFRAEIEKLLGR